MNPHKAIVDVAAEKQKAEDSNREEMVKKTYSVEFILAFRAKYKDRPVNMALLDFPHKKRRT